MVSLSFRSRTALKNHFHANARNNRRVRYRSGWSNDLKITCQPQPRSNVKVVKHFDLVLGTRRLAREKQEVEILFENLAEVCVGVRDAGVVLWPALEESGTAKACVEKIRDWTDTFVRERDLREKPPALSFASLDDVLTKRV